MAKAHSPIRLDAALMAAAEATAREQHRSTAEQIEFWAAVGQLIAPKLNADDLASLQAHVAEVAVVPAKAPSADYIWAKLGARFEPGAEADPIVGHGVRYQSSEQPGFIERINEDGTVEVGNFTNGEFVPQ